ncbi:hypothetical protein N9M26_01165 [Alphaproteobacteria bacterium]|nr:hypothetical protein [Alphaproteobacteria bacterium]
MALSTIPFSGLGADASKQGVNFRNLIINGDMSIAQRGTSKTGETGTGYKSLDRWRFQAGSGITSTFSQSTDVPSGQGFAYSFKQEATTGDADLSTDQYNAVVQRIEGQMLQQLKKGTSNAESTTLSFWVKASVTGTYIVNITDDDNSRVIAKSYTINSANTWEKKTITFDGDTTGTLDNDNARSITVSFWQGAGTDFTSGTLQTTWGSNVTANLAVGQVNAFASNNNTWQITGVQWEVGTSASDFEFLPYDVNFERCRRYYYVVNPNNTYYPTIQDFYCYNSSNCYGSLKFPTPMRTGPSVSMTNNGSFYYYPQTSFTINTSMLYSWNSDGEISYVRFYDGNAFSFDTASGLFEGGTFNCNAEL